MKKKLNRREQVMLTTVVTIATLFAASLAFSAFRRSYEETATDLSTRKEELASLRELLKERDLWTEREVWLAGKQPQLENAERAGVDLLESVRRTARAHGVLLEQPELGRNDRKPAYQTVSISVQTKSGWNQLVAFMNEFQQPEQFVVFEETALQTDSSNPTQIHGQFRIAKWYAP